LEYKSSTNGFTDMEQNDKVGKRPRDHMGLQEFFDERLKVTLDLSIGRAVFPTTAFLEQYSTGFKLNENTNWEKVDSIFEILDKKPITSAHSETVSTDNKKILNYNAEVQILKRK
jgi:hypothetical protein